jgi:hypothetical protein
MNGSSLTIQAISIYLALLGILGTFVLLLMTAIVMWRYRNTRLNGFQWSLRSWRLRQLCAIASLFFIAMAASYWVIHQPLGWIYFLVAFKTGTWWFRSVLSRRAWP